MVGIYSSEAKCDVLASPLLETYKELTAPAANAVKPSYFAQLVDKGIV
jgi:hypothetical protein